MIEPLKKRIDRCCVFLSPLCLGFIGGGIYDPMVAISFTVLVYNLLVIAICDIYLRKKKSLNEPPDSLKELRRKFVLVCILNAIMMLAGFVGGFIAQKNLLAGVMYTALFFVVPVLYTEIQIHFDKKKGGNNIE